MTAPLREDEVLLGEIVGVFGFRGEVRLLVHHREGTTLLEEREVTLLSPEGARRDVRLRARQGAGKRVLARITGVDDEAGARALQGWHVVVARASLPAPEAGEHYVHDVLGRRVEDEEGVALGTVEDVVLGEVDVWVVRAPGGEEGFLVATRENVISVESERIVVRTGAVDAGE